MAVPCSFRPASIPRKGHTRGTGTWDDRWRAPGRRKAPVVVVAEQNPQRPEAGSHVSLGELGDAALMYARNDIPIFPVWNPTENGGCACPKGLDCPHPAKHPITRRGFKEATTDLDIVRMW